MNFLKRNKNRLKNSDEGFQEIRFEEKVKERFGKVIPDLYPLVSEGNFEMKPFEKLTAAIPEAIKPIRFMNWLVKNNIPVGDYIDYVYMIKELGIPFRGDYIVIPKNWEEKHSEIVENYSVFREAQLENGVHLRMTDAVRELIGERERIAREKEEAKLRVETQKRLQELLIAQVSFDKYEFILPKNEAELIEEGRILHHCVGSYANKHFVRGTTLIVFVRDKKDSRKPLYTLEINNHRIVQLRGKRNTAASEAAWAEAQLFLEHCEKLGLAV